MTQPRRVASARTLALSPPHRRPAPGADWATLDTDLCLSQWVAATESADCEAQARGAHKRYSRRGRASQRRQVSLWSLRRRLRRRQLGILERCRAADAADMEPEPQPEQVTLLVKSPNQRHRDLELSGDRSWSVSRLKAHLSRVYPERPVSGDPGVPRPAELPELTCHASQGAGPLPARPSPVPLCLPRRLSSLVGLHPSVPAPC